LPCRQYIHNLEFALGWNRNRAREQAPDVRPGLGLHSSFAADATLEIALLEIRAMLNCMDIQNPRLLYFKAALFVLAGLLASAGILLIDPNLRVAALLGIAIWSFARAYYFAFYVIQHYVDPSYQFAGLGSFLRYLLRRH
jgi:hypothetical protein